MEFKFKTQIQNGEAKAVVQDIASYEQTQETLALLKILALGNRQIEENKVLSTGEVIQRLRKRDKDNVDGFRGSVDRRCGP